MSDAQLDTAAATLIDITAKVTDDMLIRPTPCAGVDVAGLLGHVVGLSQAFAAAGRKEFGPLTDTPPDPAAYDLPDPWRPAIVGELRALVRAWDDDASWEGMTRAGGVDAPAQILGTIALSEVVLHGWDLARAIGAEYEIDGAIAKTVFDFHHPPRPQEEREGMFGPVVDVPEDAPLMDRLAGLAGRDPFWPHGTLEE
ncbi:TIGR03086 family metal-binding protein [Gordonia sp. ABSL1-1]|uniref:TIGR03086 family metal-binding protein n=1 Tax=Gordonia sp. ABSL1-1 TaxID=3053923 RepID=UPI0025739B3C|nr:TIGR03086 family metal-binding protein [Gordonia sp. ABSL1-1]MDL9936200.1 TIGR03086 family metal-binding protein [Gordonia sp. ABSL1-1]